MRTLALLLVLVSPAVGSAQTTKPTIVLVHGAFADGSSWAKVIPILQNDGYSVIAVQNPLTSLSDDVATTKRVIDAQKGPVVLVGHSYGGAVITAAAAGAANVKALVYVAAFAPDANEVLAAPSAQFSAPALSSAQVSDAAGFLYIERSKFHDAFCKDLLQSEARVMAATQKPVRAAVFDAPVPVKPGRRSDPGTSLRPMIGRSTRSSNAFMRSASVRRRPKSNRVTCHSCRTRKKWRR